MSMESDMASYLRTQSGIAELVGNRIYPNAAPQNAALPLLVYQRLSGGHAHMLSGSAGYARPQMQITVCSRPDDQSIEPLSFSLAKRIAESVRQAMQGFRGYMGSTVVRAVSLDNERDIYQPPTDGSGQGTDMIVLVYSILYEETKPVFA